MAIGYDDRDWEDFLEDIAIPRVAVDEDEGCPNCGAAEDGEHDPTCDMVDEEYETDEDEESDAD
jgi:hypothetical protein